MSKYFSAPVANDTGSTLYEVHAFVEREEDERGSICAGVWNPAHGPRIAACLNACDDLPTEALEAGVVKDMLEALENLENDNGAIPDHAWDMVQAAIAKAKGNAK